MKTAFDESTLDRLRKARVVRIETSAGTGRPVHQTAIWLVVDDAGRVLIRSVRGTRGRWYRELVANPLGAVLLRDERIPVRSEAAADEERVAACSAGFHRKYGNTASTLSMLQDHTLPTTLELHPGGTGTTVRPASDAA